MSQSPSKRRVRPHTLVRQTIGAHLRTAFTAGLFIIVPLVISYLVLEWLFNLIDWLLQPLLEQAWGRRIPGAGAVALIIIIYVAGLLAGNFIGRRLIGLGQSSLMRLPFIRVIYKGARELVESFGGSKDSGFKKVVLIEYPQPGKWSIGFLTSTVLDESQRKLGVVYIPTAPTPNSGVLAIAPMGEIYDTQLTVNEAMRLCISGGILTPAQLAMRAPYRP